MYKRSSLIILVCLFVFAGFASQVFAIDFSDALTQSAQDTSTAATLFAGKAQVSNLYSQAIRIVKQNEISATDQAIRAVVTYFFTHACKKIDTNDVIRVLYNSDFSFAIFFQHLVLTDVSRRVPTVKEVNASYARFLACDNHVVKDRTNVEKNVQSLYYQALNSNFYSSTLAQDNIGEDLFWN